jgi:hypothetical protein
MHDEFLLVTSETHEPGVIVHREGGARAPAFRTTEAAPQARRARLRFGNSLIAFLAYVDAAAVQD